MALKFNIAFTFIVAMFSLNLIFGNNGLLSFVGNYKILKYYEYEIAVINTEIENYEKLISYINESSDYQEQLTRNILYMIKKGEDLYINQTYNQRKYLPNNRLNINRQKNIVPQ